MSSSYSFHTTLYRNSLSTPWGFKLEGGKEYGSPLVIQRVFQGSPASGNLQRGDVILNVQQNDVMHMYHQDALDLLNKATLSLQLTVRRGQSYQVNENVSYNSHVSNYQPHHKYVSNLNNRYLPSAALDIDNSALLVRNRMIEVPKNPKPVLSQTGSPMLPINSSATLPRSNVRSSQYVMKSVPIIETVQPFYKYQEKQLVDKLYDSLQRAVNKPRSYFGNSSNLGMNSYSEHYFENSNPLGASSRVISFQRTKHNSSVANNPRFYNEFEDYNNPPWKGNTNYFKLEKPTPIPITHEAQPKVIYTKHEASDYSSSPQQLKVVNKQVNGSYGYGNFDGASSSDF